MGPGLGSEEKQLDYYSKILTGGIKIPLILDADGIKLLNTANRKYILEKGGSENPMKLIEDFLGRKPDNNAFLRKQGIAE